MSAPDKGAAPPFTLASAGLDADGPCGGGLHQTPMSTDGCVAVRR
eukprot:COSAG01_NODE_3924_length_5529_cov_1.581584_3_plen_45_part_00